jgi:hypothetical protein
MKLNVGGIEDIVLAGEAKIPRRFRVGIFDRVDCLDGCEIGDVGFGRAYAYDRAVTFVQGVYINWLCTFEIVVRGNESSKLGVPWPRQSGQGREEVSSNVLRIVRKYL